MNKFRVVSVHYDEATQESREMVEVTRSDKRVAEDDAALIRSILHRKSWVEEQT